MKVGVKSGLGPSFMDVSDSQYSDHGDSLPVASQSFVGTGGNVVVNGVIQKELERGQYLHQAFPAYAKDEFQTTGPADRGPIASPTFVGTGGDVIIDGSIQKGTDDVLPEGFIYVSNPDGDSINHNQSRLEAVEFHFIWQTDDPQFSIYQEHPIDVAIPPIAPESDLPGPHDVQYSPHIADFWC